MGSYKRDLIELGYMESGALPLDYASLAELVQYMDELIPRTATDHVIIAAVHCDVCVVLYFWESAAADSIGISGPVRWPGCRSARAPEYSRIPTANDNGRGSRG